jgi:hypothetical protein
LLPHPMLPRPVPVPTTYRFFGLDLGKMVDHTAFVMLEYTWPPLPQENQRPPTRPAFVVPALKRWPLGTPLHRDFGMAGQPPPEHRGRGVGRTAEGESAHPGR